MKKCDFCFIKDLNKKEGAVTVVPGPWSAEESRAVGIYVYQHPADIDMHSNSFKNPYHTTYLVKILTKIPVKCDCKGESSVNKSVEKLGE